MKCIDKAQPLCYTILKVKAILKPQFPHFLLDKRKPLWYTVDRKRGRQNGLSGNAIVCKW